MSSLLGGQINPQTPPSWYQTVMGPAGVGQQQAWGTAMSNATMNGGNLLGVPGYTGPLSPDVNQTMLPNVWGGWQGQAPGVGDIQSATNFAQNASGQAFNAQTPYGGQFGSQWGNILQQGGVGGAPTDAMQNMLQWGGAAIQPGSPIIGMQGLVNNGFAGAGGIPLATLAAGQGAALNPLQGVINAQAPTDVGLGETYFGRGPTQAGLQQLIAGGGDPINQLPAWQAMVGAQQRNIAEGRAQLAEQFGASDNRFSTSFGTAATDYENQAVAQQNALLGQMTATAGENAQNRLLSAAGTLSGQGYGAASEVGALGGAAAGQFGSLAGGAAGQVGALSAGAQQNLWGASNQAGMGLFNNQNAQLGNYMNYGLGQGGLAQGFNQQSMQGANLAAQNYYQNLTLGSQLGGQQYGVGQNQINNQYQEFLRTQPQNNPLLGYAQNLATYYPSQYTAGYVPGSLNALLGGTGGILGAIPGLAHLSDRRLKEDITQVGDIKGIPFYTYRFKGDSQMRLGPMAQEVAEKYPEAVYEGDETRPWLIHTGVLLNSLARKES